MAQIADIDIESYGRDMFKAGSNLIGRTSEELFARDFKKFSVNDIMIGVGQVNCMTKRGNGYGATANDRLSFR